MLTRSLEPVQLSPKAFQLLQFLIEKRPRALSARDLYHHLWPDTFVVKANLRNLVAEIRAATGDRSGAPMIVRTVFGFGYAFAGEAVEESGEQQPSLYQLIHRAAAYPLFLGENIIGRDGAATIVIDAPGISRRHALLRIADDQLTLEDLGSKNGTFADGARVRHSVPVRDGTEIRFAHVATRIQLVRSNTSTLTEL